jgi:hypothetical protein
MDTELIEYLGEIVPGALLECAGCPAEREAAVMIKREGKLYHSQECADRSCAVLDRNRGDVVVCDNWKV